MIDVTFEQEQDFVCDFTSDDQIDVSMDAPSVVDVKVNGTSVVDVKGVANVSVPTTAEEVHALPDTTPIPVVPTDVSAFRNDAGYITASDIPPLVTDLGNIDPSDYDDDLEKFLNTLLDNGEYKFVWEDGDDFEYFVEIQSLVENGNGELLQHYWYTEEGAKYQYNRCATFEAGECVGSDYIDYMTSADATTSFAPKTHSHYENVSKAKTVWDYCDDDLAFDNGKPYIIYADTLNSKNWLIERYSAMRSPNQRYIRLYDLGDASHFFLRSGLYSAGVITWGNWKEYPSGGGGGMNITVNGTNYPITAITLTTISGVEGVLVEYDDGNNGQLFFADGVGLNTVKTVIEGTIPHDTSELTNGAGFLTISDLPIYDGGVQ